MVLKQVIVVRSDLKLPKGKMSAQCAHAAVEAVVRSEKDLVKKWRSEGSMKIVVKVDDLKELYRINQDAKDFGLVTALITDAGRTVIAPGTTTCVGIGPDEEEKIDSVTGKLGLM
ncbi:peptidyl-tRNA hydrolase Pth2 [Candidatus Woesearchaeota archaeon]|nr:peptidyl-tRNA hydrolase Pth2 [Candidatus Woesearchaeota archaeon]